MKTEITETLTTPESAEFNRLDKLVAAGAKTFMDVGMALVQIHKGRLYRDQFGTFEAYAASRGIKRREAYKLMTAVQVSLELGDVPHGAQTSKKALLALAEVPKKLRKQTFKDAAKKAKGTPTEKDIIEVSAEATNKPAQSGEPYVTPAEREIKSVAAGGKVVFPNPVISQGVPIDMGKVDVNMRKLFDEQPATMLREIPKGSTLTPKQFQTLMDEMEAMIPDDCDHTKFGVPAHKFAERQMNFGKAKSSAYY